MMSPTRRLGYLVAARLHSFSSTACLLSHGADVGVAVASHGRSYRYMHSLVDITKAPGVDLRTFGLTFIPEFITEEEHQAMVQDFDPPLRKSRYEEGHWDAVISRFRERQYHLERLSPLTQAVVKRAWELFPRQQAYSSSFPPGVSVGPPMPYVHALDLAADGEIRDHVDSVKFSGAIVCGVSLLSDAIMRLTEVDPEEHAGTKPKQPPGPSAPAPHNNRRTVDITLQRRSLYIITGEARYNWGHAILGDGPLMKRQRRISVILRDELVGPSTADASSSKSSRGATMGIGGGGAAQGGAQTASGESHTSGILG